MPYSNNRFNNHKGGCLGMEDHNLLLTNRLIKDLLKMIDHNNKDKEDKPIIDHNQLSIKDRHYQINIKQINIILKVSKIHNMKQIININLV